MSKQGNEYSVANSLTGKVHSKGTTKKKLWDNYQS